jgi:DNA repair protein RadA/Sms
MNVLQTSNKQFTRASDVKIPEIYNRRFRTEKEDLDAIFGGQGFLPGMTFTLAAAPGTGKTSFLIQILELLENTGKKTAYVSGEEGIEQLAFTSRRLQVQRVPLANMTCIDDICAEIKKHKFDFIVLDSLPALTTKKHMNARQREEYIATKIVQTAKEHECVIGTIMHFTKTGTYKGSTLLPHSVDCNIIMTRNKEDVGLRDVEITKNRFGFSGFVSFAMTDRGFDFEAVETQVSAEHNKGKSKGASKKETVYEALKGSEKTVAELYQETQISVGYLNTLLRELTNEGRVIKNGRGPNAKYLGRV